MTPKANTLSLTEFFDSLYRPRRLLGGAQKTAEQYAVAIRHFGRFLGRSAAVADLNEDRISGFLSWFSDGRKLATVWSARKNLMALAAYAQRKGLLVEVPDVRPIQRDSGEVPTAYTVGDITQLISAAQNVKGRIGGIPAGSFWPAFFLTAFDTGARWSPLWALEWKDYRPPYILFRAEHSKSRKDQSLKISGQCIEAIEAIHKPERRIIFDHPFSCRARYNHVRKIFIAAGLPHGRRDLLQRIRRTTATLMHRRGADATAQLGHSSDAITRRHYLDASNDVQAADVLPRPLLSNDNGNGQSTPHNPAADELRRQARELLATADKLEQATA